MTPGDFRSVAQRIPVTVWESDARLGCTFINSRWGELTGQSLEQAVGAGWRAVMHLDDRPLLDGAARDAVAHGVPIDVELRVTDRAGALRWMRLVATPDTRGEAVVGFVGLLIDITAARQASAELEEREGRLRLLEARNQALLESLPDLLFQFDADGRFVDYQAGSSRSFFLPPEEFLGRSISDVLPPQIGDAALAAMKRARESGEGQRHEYELELPGAARRDFEARISPMKSGGFLGLVRDVTELKRAERQLIAAREQAVAASSSKSQFLANVSHEIRTPLNGIILVTQLLRSLSLPADVKDYVGVLENAGESLLALVNQVLDLSKIEAERLELDLAPFDLGALVRQATRGFDAEATTKGIELIVEVSAPGEGSVVGDAGRVRQIVTNLVGNAVKFTNAGAVTVTLGVSPDGVFVLTVRDTGPGVPPGWHDSIFEPFVQVSGQRRQGTGLGLSIARRLARLMGGDLQLVDAAGQGSQFEARLPLARGAANVVSRRPVATGRRLKVLLAEDNEINARLTGAMLSWLGHDVETVRDGRSALELTMSRRFDLVFMDVEMPLLDGLEATRRIRAEEQTSGRHLPIIALTANAMKADELACLSAGMDAYLPKPVSVEALSDMLAWFGSTGR
ncbi:MAG: PAS domain-containing protein [Myxococcales bacterium]|nr:PAS domain-containing protein [Myxococcales bacterium]